MRSTGNLSKISNPWRYFPAHILDDFAILLGLPTRDSSSSAVNSHHGHSSHLLFLFLRNAYCRYAEIASQMCLNKCPTFLEMQIFSSNNPMEYFETSRVVRFIIEVCNVYCIVYQ